MAKNYTLYEAACIIAEGRDLAAIQDIGKRYPFVLSRVTELTAKAGEDFVEFIKYLPEHTTANKFNAAVRAQIVEADEDDDEEEEVVEAKPKKKEKPAKTKPKKVEVEEDDDDDEVDDLMSLPAKKLFKMCEDAGFTPSKNREKAYYIKLLNSASEDDDDEEEEVKPAKKAKKSEKKPAKKVEPEDDWDEEDEDDDDDWDI